MADAGAEVQVAISPAKRQKKAAAATAAATDLVGEAEAVITTSPAKAGAKRKEPVAQVTTGEDAEGGEEDGAVAPAKARKTAAKRKAAPKKAAVAPESKGGEEIAAAAKEGEAGDSVPPSKKPRKSRAKTKATAAVEEAEKGAEPEGEAEGGEAAKPKQTRKKKKEEPPRVRWSPQMRPPPPDQPHFKVLSWNVAGLRGVVNKQPDFMAKLIELEKPDIVCLQETKISDKHIEQLLPSLQLPAGWHAAWSCSQDKAGYSGVATFSRVAPLKTSVGMDMPQHDGEGRLLISEFKDFYLLNVYVPNSGEGLRRLEYRVQADGWDDSLAKIVKKLQQSKPVVVTGDLNCAHQEIDIHNPKTNKRSAGFTQEERDSFGSRYLADEASGGCGLVDTYRAQFPEVVGYTYYSHRFNCRAKGIGWRLDYFLTSSSLHPKVHDSWMLQDFTGSDHVPLGITVLGTLADG